MHQLVAAYLDYKPEPFEDAAASREAESGPIVPSRTPWMAGMGGIPASEALRNAATPEEGLAAAEQMFFGNLMEI